MVQRMRGVRLCEPQYRCSAVCICGAFAPSLCTAAECVRSAVSIGGVASARRMEENTASSRCAVPPCRFRKRRLCVFVVVFTLVEFLSVGIDIRHLEGILEQHGGEGETGEGRGTAQEQ